ncbi:amidohydrolase family protein [Terriglobus sp.]|uniref:amidohydrolase family protein n=1 Tax=Terriglobus sp. TaxID=1889013 RepID=UPI003AFF66A3
MRRIALEEHFVMNEPEHIDRWKSLIPTAPKSVTDKILTSLVDVGEGRLKAMAQAGIDMAVLSDAGIVQNVLDPTPALRLARESNDYLAKIVQQTPEHYAGFATVPLVDPNAGADEFERAVTQLGFKGALINGQTNGHYLDDDRYSVFWERVQALGVPVYLHAADPLVAPVTYEGCPQLTGAIWSWTAETAAHALRLIFNGTLTKYPDVKVILGHMGETLPFLLWRIDRRTKAFATGPTITPSEVFRKNIVITTSGVFSDPPLLCSLAEIGDDNILYSVDHPFEVMKQAGLWFDKTPISAETREKISWRNASGLLRL